MKDQDLGLADPAWLVHSLSGKSRKDIMMLAHHLLDGIRKRRLKQRVSRLLMFLADINGSALCGDARGIMRQRQLPVPLVHCLGIRSDVSNVALKPTNG